MLFYPPPTVSPVQAQCSRQRSPAHSVSKAGRRASSASAAPCSWSSSWSNLNVPTRSSPLQGVQEGRAATSAYRSSGEILAKRLWGTHRDVMRPSELQATPRHPQWSGRSRSQSSKIEAASRPRASENTIWLHISRRTPPAKAAEVCSVQALGAWALARPALTLCRLEVVTLGRAARAGGASLGNQDSHQQCDCQGCLHVGSLGRSFTGLRRCADPLNT